MLPASPPAFVVASRIVRPLRAVCPDGPAAPLATTPRMCPALDVNGRLDPGALALEPAFDINVPSTQLAHSDPNGNVTLTAFGAEGNVLFTMPFVARDSFHVDVPVTPALASAIRRVRLTAAGATVERVATTHGEPSAEVVGTGDRQIVVAWDARAFPAVRVTTEMDAAAVVARGESTYEQTSIATVARFVVVDFSDGVRSVARTFRVFGR